MASYFANRKKDIDAATKEAVATGDTSKLDKLLEHTIAEAGGSDEASVLDTLTRSLRGK